MTERTESTQESLGGSLLTYMGSEASQADLREVIYSLFLLNTELSLDGFQAFCRDIDVYSFEFPAPEPEPEVLLLRECAGVLTGAPYSLAAAELGQLEAEVGARTRQQLRPRESMHQARNGSEDNVMLNLADEAGPFLVTAITTEGYILGGFLTTKWFERTTGGWYGYDRDDHAFIFGLRTPAGRQPVFLPVREEHRQQAIYRGKGTLVNFGRGASHQEDLSLFLTATPPLAGSKVQWYGPEGTRSDILLGGEEREIVDWHVFGRPV